MLDHDASRPALWSTNAVPPGGRADRSAAGCTVEVERHATGPGAVADVLVLRVVGEIDLLTLFVVERTLTAARHQAPAHLIVDLTDVTFCCVRGFTLLATAAHATTAHGATFAVSGLNSHFDRYVALLWRGQPITRHPRLAEAIATATRVRQGAEMRSQAGARSTTGHARVRPVRERRVSRPCGLEHR